VFLDISVRQGLKPVSLESGCCGPTEQAAEKPQGWVFLDISARQGLKPVSLESSCCGTTKVVPCYKARSGRRFSAACEVVPLLQSRTEPSFSAACKARPFIISGLRHDQSRALLQIVLLQEFFRSL